MAAGADPHRRRGPAQLFSTASCPSAWRAAWRENLHPRARAHPALRLGSTAELQSPAAALAAAGTLVAWDGELPDVRPLFTADPCGNRLEILAPAEARRPPSSG
jgi:hypothetical protein